MKLFDTTTVKVTEKVIEVNKGLGALTIECEPKIVDLTTEKINIQVQRANGENQEITNGTIPLREFLIIGTIGDNAIGSTAVCETQATVDLCEAILSAIHLYEKDILRISLSGLNNTKIYKVFGHEAPLTTDDVFTYERKSMNSEHENMDFAVGTHDACIITNKASITEINLRFDNGNVVKTSPEELIMLSEAADPVAQVQQDGTVLSSFADYIQLPLKGIVNINIRKEQGDIVSLVFRHDQDLKA